jgi:hypothetical protein
LRCRITRRRARRSHPTRFIREAAAA